MDRNTYTGLFLIMLILVGSFFYMNNENKKIMQQQHIDSLKKADYLRLHPAVKKALTAATDSTKAVKVIDSATLKSPFGVDLVGDQKYIVIENSEMLLKVSTLGGRIQYAELKNFKTFDKKPLILFSGDNNHFGLNFMAGGKVINTNDLYFKPSVQSLNVTGQDSASVTFRLNYSATQYIDYVYTLQGTSNLVGFNVILHGLDGVIDNNKIGLSWQASLNKTERDMPMERQYSTVFYKSTNDDVDNLSVTKDDSATVKDKKVQWVAFKQHFFSSALIYKDGFAAANVQLSADTSNKTEVKQMLANLTLPVSSTGIYPFRFYFGNNKFSVLHAQGYGLERIIDLGWGPLKYINRYIVLPVFDFLKQFGWNYGIIILMLTLLLKVALSPLTYKSYLSMAKMRVLKPELDEIKAKVGEDNPTLLQQESMKLYKKAGVNPLGGCLPMLLQMPIVFAFLRFFPALFELRGQSFLWMHDLSTSDDLIKFGVNVPFIGTYLSLMCLLMTISTFIYTYFNNQVSGATGQMKYIGYITPIMFIFILNKYPSGLNYYYFLANMMTFAQQYIIRLMVDDKKIHAQLQENKKKPEEKKKKSGFAERMDQYVRNQQQLPAKKK